MFASSASLSFKFFPHPQKLEIGFTISHIHRAVMGSPSPSYLNGCTHGLQFSKNVVSRVQLSCYMPYFVLHPRIFKISLHGGMCTQPVLPGVVCAVPAGLRPHKPRRKYPDTCELENVSNQGFFVLHQTDPPPTA